MELYFNKEVAFSIIEQQILLLSPRWMFNESVYIGPYHSADERDLHVSQTIGSMEWLWSNTEEFRFDCESLALVSAFLGIDDTTLDSPELLDAWSDVPVQVGIPKL